MSSLAQIDANRANAQLSTGPKTAEGLAATKHNATKHGLTGKQIVIKGEDPADFDNLRAQLLTDHAPANEREAMLVEEIAQNWWRLMRARRIESEVVAKLGDAAIILDPEAAKTHQRAVRYVNSIERSWYKATKELDRLQDARLAKEVEAAKAATFRQFILAHPAPARPIGSVSSKPPAAPPAADSARPTDPRLNG